MFFFIKIQKLQKYVFTLRKSKIPKTSKNPKSKNKFFILYSLFNKIQKELFEYVCRILCTIAQGKRKVIWLRVRKVNCQLRGSN